MSKISNELDRLSELREDLATINARVEAAVPQSLKDQRSEAAEEVKSCEAGIKKIAENLRTDHKRTFRGKLLQIVYTDTISYPKAAIIKHVPPRYRKLAAKESKSWSIRKAAAE